MPRLIQPTPDTQALIGRLADLDAGADVRRLQRRSRSTFFFDGAGDCEDPVGLTIEGRQYRAVGGTAVAEVNGNLRNAPLFLDIDGRCRRCAPCLKYRRNLWARRAYSEVAWAPRTWMGTLTLRPDRQFYHHSIARSLEAARGRDLDAQDEQYIFAKRCNAVGKSLTLFFKRLRKETGGYIRYVAVYERHASGDPHLHLLLHETDLIHFVRKSVLERQWHDGFSHWRLVNKDEPKELWYVTKYLAKELTTRVRASLHYGSPDSVGMCATAHADKSLVGRMVMRAVKETTPKPSVQGQPTKEQTP